MRKIAFILVVVFPVSLFAADKLESPRLPNLTPEMVKEMAQTYFYRYGQSLSVESIGQRFPDLKPQLVREQSNFDRVFGTAINNIDQILKKEFPSWEEEKRKTMEQLRNRLEPSTVTREQAALFLATVKERAKGKIESPFIETLLVCNPSYLRQPASEFAEGWKSTLRVKDNPKAKGADFQIEYPRSWKVKEGIREMVIYLITSENGRGLDSIGLLAAKMPLPPGQKLTKEEVADILDPTKISEILPAGAKLKKATPVVLDRLPGIMVLFDQDLRRLDVLVHMRCLWFVAVRDDQLEMIQCGTGTIVDDPAVLDQQFTRLEPLFKLVGNSFVDFAQH